MRDILRRWAGPGIVALVGFGFDVADFFGSSFLAYAAWITAGLWVVYLAWPGIKRRLRPWVRRVRIRSPIALASSEGSADSQLTIKAQLPPPTVVLGTDERPLVGDDELWEKAYEHRSFWMAEFARKAAPSGAEQPILRDRRFYDCRIYGPVVFGPLMADEIERVFVDCEWIEDEEVVSWPPAENRREYIGAVRLEDCRFEGCRLSRVGLLRQEEPSLVEQLTAARDELGEVKNQELQDQRRKRIEEWRGVIRNFDFESEKFGATDTYSQMRPHLQGQIAQMFEGNSTVHVVNEARGDEIVRYELLDEVARIEKEWGLI